MEYTVYENIKKGTRFFSSYSTKEPPSRLKIIKHVETIEEAQAVCAEHEDINWKDYWDRMRKQMSGDFSDEE